MENSRASLIESMGLGAVRTSSWRRGVGKIGGWLTRGFGMIGATGAVEGGRRVIDR
jgi:hypothetical protein